MNRIRPDSAPRPEPGPAPSRDPAPRPEPGSAPSRDSAPRPEPGGAPHSEPEPRGAPSTAGAPAERRTAGAKAGTLLGAGGAVWAVAGLTALLGFAVLRLAAVALDALAHHPFAWYHWAALAAVVPAMAWSEGVRGFQRRFSPRVAERTMRIRREPTAARVVLAPFYAAGYFGGSRRERIGVWLGTAAIVVLVVLVHRLDQPWRGIVDAGVVAGLGWGMAATLALSARAWRRREASAAPHC